MGISGLTKVISDTAPSAILSKEIKHYFGRKVAIDASMSIYQFLIAVRQQDGQVLTNEDGAITSHLMGLFYRTLRMVDHGIKPVYVFDGKPPSLKTDELAKRLAKRDDAAKELEKATETGNVADMDKFGRRTVKVTKEHNDECKRLLRLLGIPYVEAPCEAEAQCAALCKAGKVYAAASEDMDTLTFGSPILLRHLTFSETRKMPINEIHLDKALAGLEMTQAQFVDLCILLGCDYCNSIKGIGPHRALQLMKQHGSLEKVLANLDKSKYPVPAEWEFKDARRLFTEPDVKDPDSIELKWEAPDVSGTVQFLVTEKGFNEERVRKSLEKLEKNMKKATQGRLDSFFKVIPNPNGNSLKRKADDKAKAKTPLQKKKAPGGARKPRR